MSVQVSLSLGSNIDRTRNIRSAIDTLYEAFNVIAISPVYESEAVGFDGAPFYNLMVLIETTLSLSEVNKTLKVIEDQHGRVRTGPKFSSRTLDIDVVTYGDFVGELDGVELPRPELFYNAFVMLPMIDLLGSAIEPKTGKAYKALATTIRQGQRLAKIPFSFTQDKDEGLAV